MQVVESSRGRVHVVAGKQTGCGSRLFHGGQTYFWPDAVKVTCRRCQSFLYLTSGTCPACHARPGSYCMSIGGKRAKRHSRRFSD